MQKFEEDLREIVRRNEGFMSMLRTVRVVAPPTWYIGAGAVRSLVWDHLHGLRGWRVPRDIDVTYFDSGDVSEETESSYEKRLFELRPELPWEVRNQARVHLWYGRRFGFDVPRLDSIHDAVATWPEYASCVAISLEPDDRLGVIAPYGLDDLFSVTIRRNPARVSVEEYRRRIATKKYADRWKDVRIITE